MSGHINREKLEHLIRDGAIDTVLMVFPDLQGRLTGKRTTGRFFLQSVADAGTENCDYLIACDMDNNPVPGYRFTSYEQGYGDMLARADWSTVRIIPWVEKTAMIMCDLLDVDTGIDDSLALLYAAASPEADLESYLLEGLRGVFLDPYLRQTLFLADGQRTQADIAARLEGKGWILREVLPRRQRALSLTSEGQAVLDRLVPALQAMNTQMLAKYIDEPPNLLCVVLT